MGFFSKLFQGPQPDMEKSNANRQKIRQMFRQAVEKGDSYRLIVGYTEDVSRFNYGFVHGSKTKIGNLIGRVEPGYSDHCGSPHRTGSFRLRRPRLLPPG